VGGHAGLDHDRQQPSHDRGRQTGNSGHKKDPLINKKNYAHQARLATQKKQQEQEAAKVAELKQMFPNVDDDVLLSVLQVIPHSHFCVCCIFLTIFPGKRAKHIGLH